MKYLASLHSVVKKRRTFGNITIEDESSSSLEIQDLDPHDDNTGNLIEDIIITLNNTLIMCI